MQITISNTKGFVSFTFIAGSISMIPWKVMLNVALLWWQLGSIAHASMSKVAEESTADRQKKSALSSSQ
jgi:hypothetical protein